MNITTFRGEKNVSEIVDKQYARLTPRQREKVEAAVLKANPRLRNISKIRQGTILHLPDIPELRTKTSRSLENPDAQIAKNVADALSSFEDRFAEGAGVEEKSLKAQTALLKNAKFKKVISNSEALQALAKETGKALEIRTKTLSQQQGDVKKAISQALADLEKI